MDGREEGYESDELLVESFELTLDGLGWGGWTNTSRGWRQGGRKRIGPERGREGRGMISSRLDEGAEEAEGSEAHHLFEEGAARRKGSKNATVSISSCILDSMTGRGCVRARGGPEVSIGG